VSRLSQVPTRVSVAVVPLKRTAHASPATAPVPIAASPTSRKFQVRTRLLAAVAERQISVGVFRASVHATLAPRHPWKVLLARRRLNAIVEEMRRIALVRQESALAAAAPSRFLPLGQRQGVDCMIIRFC
jgi:hypothetical protein